MNLKWIKTLTIFLALFCCTTARNPAFAQQGFGNSNAPSALSNPNAPNTQNGSISGTVTDISNHPLAAVSVYLDGTTHGVVTNTEGRYRLPGIKPGHYNVAISFVGYARQIKPVEVPAAGKEIVLNIKLLEGSYHLSEVTVRVSREDPAVSIIKHATAKRRFYLNQVQAYRCQVYIKGIQKLRDAPKKIFGQDVKGQLETMGLDSGKRGILYLSESVSKLSVKKPGKIHEEMISSKVSGRNNSYGFKAYNQ